MVLVLEEKSGDVVDIRSHIPGFQLP
jgi:hypothetical protein